MSNIQAFKKDLLELMALHNIDDICPNTDGFYDERLYIEITSGKQCEEVLIHDGDRYEVITEEWCFKERAGRDG